ncbi:MAG: hypothetical protein KAH33_00770 [Candidatus Delongbacteria bacterium]|nr:hypothetical protein [Candidatus Delongbacteria bacterium]
MVRVIKYLLPLLLCFQFLNYAKLYYFSSDDIKNIPARDVYGILEKIADLHGISYGRTGQLMQVKTLGKDPYRSNIYINDLPLTNFNSGITNLSSLSLDRIDNIIIDDSPVNNSSINIYIYTKKYSMDEPVTEMIYRDAFYNHRNLSMHLGQKFSENTSFLLYAEMTDYSDHRESSDAFAYPYKKQNYNLHVDFPELLFFKPSIEFSYLQENIYDFSVDSVLNDSRAYKTYRWIVNFNSLESDLIDNKLSFINSFKHDQFDTDNKNYSIYDQFTYKDSTNIFRLRTHLEFYNYQDLGGESSFSIEPSYKKNFGTLNTSFFSYVKYSDITELTYSLSTELTQDIPWGFEVNSEHSIYNGSFRVLGNVFDVKFYQNNFYLKKYFDLLDFSGSIYSGIDIIEYLKNECANSTGYLSSGVIRYSKNKLKFNFLKNFNLNLEYSHRITSKTLLYDPNSTIISSLNFSDKYLNDNFQFSATIMHKYSDYYISEDNREIINNLGINLRAKILDVEIFFGIDNLMKNKYDINNNTYILNEHYVYQTIEGYDMQIFDEIWGVRWIIRY